MWVHVGGYAFVLCVFARAISCFVVTPPTLSPYYSCVALVRLCHCISALWNRPLYVRLLNCDRRHVLQIDIQSLPPDMSGGYNCARGTTLAHAGLLFLYINSLQATRIIRYLFF
jgi:hypothetical protein